MMYIYDIESTLETIFTNVVSNKNTDFQFSIFLGVKFYNNIMF